MDKKQEIIEIAAELIHQYGYHSVGIQKILDLANVPKGSFYYYFKNKEDLGLSVINYFIDQTKSIVNQFEESISGLEAFFQCYFSRFEEFECTRGCPIGNLALELSDVNENFRLGLFEWSHFMENTIFNILEKSSLKNCEKNKELASFIVSSFEGVLLKAKLEKSMKPIEEFKYFIFKVLLT